MVNSQFGALLKEFEDFFHCPLNPDSQNSCLINMGVGISLQIELDKSGFVLIGCRLGVLHMGRYRENLLRAALKSHDISPPSSGIFGFSHSSNQLILFIKMNPQSLSSQEIDTLLTPFIAKAKLWTDAIANGEVPVVSSESSVKGPGLFGLMK